MSFFKNVMLRIIPNLNVQRNLKRYNTHTWKISSNLIDMQKDLNVTLLTQNINSIIIDNDILCFSPTVEFTYYDIGQSISKAISKNELLLNLVLSQPSPNFLDKYWDDKKLLTVRVLFFITKVLVLFKRNDNIMYRFHGIHYNRVLLNKNINYATTKQNEDSRGTPLSPLVMIQNILKKIDYKCDSFINDTENKVNFISSQTMNILDCIRYLLSLTPTVNDPPSYFVHNLRLNLAMLINSKKFLERLANKANVFTIPGGNPVKNLIRELTTLVSDLTNEGFGAGVTSEQYLGIFDFHNYDQNKRLWTITKYNHDIVDKILNKDVLLVDKNYQSIFPKKLLIKRNDLFFAYPNFSLRKMYKFLRLLQLSTNSIRFRVLGNITRDAGQYVNLQCSDAEQIPLYEGLWNIYSCRHVWTGEMYYNLMVCYRTSEKKPLWVKDALNNIS